MNGSSSPTSSSRLPVWVILIASLLVPPIAGLSVSQAIIDHPWQAIGFFLLYEILVILISLFTGVWQQLQSAWVKSIVDWINSKTKGLFYLQYYRQSLIYAHRSFDIKGLKTQADRGLDLENVFVELTMARTPPHQASTDPLHTSKVSKEDQHFIWHYLSSKEFNNENLVIIGAPGSGKTTLLQHITLILADRKKRRQIRKINYSLPFFLFLRDYSDKIKDESLFSLVDAVKIQVNKWAPPVPPGWVEHQLSRRKCLVLLDGLDEVSVVVRLKVHPLFSPRVSHFAQGSNDLALPPH